MSIVSENLNIWPPEASGSSPLFGGEYCPDTTAGVLKRAFSVGSSVALFYECNRKLLQSCVLAKDEELARRVADLFMLHQGWRLRDIGMLEV